MITRMLAYEAGELRYLDLSLEFFLEACKQHLALTWFEPVEQMGDRADVIVLGEEDKLAVDEVGVIDPILSRFPIVYEGVLLDAREPPLPSLNLALAESHFDETSPSVDYIARLLFLHFIV